MSVQYQPKGIWCNYDFLINKHYWKKKGPNASLKIRHENLETITKILAEYDVFSWPQGRTLLGIVKSGQLLEDHDDDLGIFEKDLNKLITKVKSRLISEGFSLIRETSGIVSFERGFRYVDICIFRKKNSNLIGYENKAFSMEHYSSFSSIAWKGIDLNIPKDSIELLEEMYGRKRSRMYMFFQRLKADFQTHSVADIFYEKVCPKISNYGSEHALFSKYLLRFFGPIFGIRVEKISHDDFMNLQIEPLDSFNWAWRKRHLDLVTNSGQVRKVSDIIGYITDSNNVEAIEREIEEADTASKFLEPTSLDMDFWWSGNNYFWYCIKYQFRKNVISYANANKYIEAKKSPTLYSAAYFESLEHMSDEDIEKFLSSSVLEISGNAILGGKHRVFAMIGRLVSGKAYIEMTAVIRN